LPSLLTAAVLHWLPCHLVCWWHLDHPWRRC
jgi:hypothetical protein